MYMPICYIYIIYIYISFIKMKLHISTKLLNCVYIHIFMKHTNGKTCCITCQIL